MKARKLVYGVGINDADYVTQKFEAIEVNGVRKQKRVWVCPYYRTWKGMLQRCYSPKAQERNPTYKGCSVSKEWLTFSVFKSWMEKQQWEGLQLDKDLLVSGNKVYSEKMCVFVTQRVNKFTNDRGASRGEWMIGVSWKKKNNKFQAQVQNPLTDKQEHLGLFVNEIEAHNAWLKRKSELARQLAAEQTDKRVGKALIDRYENYN